MSERPVRLVAVGHVDHGKSTLLGRLLHETGSLHEGRFEAVVAECRSRNQDFEYAFLLDALAEERHQGVTIDTAQAWLKTPAGVCTVFDAPGHREFLKNMVTGAAAADAALVTVDAREGVCEQTRRHGQLLEFLGIGQVLVAVNKMDLVGWSRDRFEEIRAEYAAFLADLGIAAPRFVPVSARTGANVTRAAAELAWHAGPTVLDALGGFRLPDAGSERPLRFAVQDVYRFDDRRVVAGRVEAGRLRAGDRVLFLPSEKRGVVKTIERWAADGAPPHAEAGESVAFTLEDQVFVERGEVVAHEDAAPTVTDVFRAKVFWMGRRPLAVGRSYTLRLLTQEVACRIESIDRVLDGATLEPREAASVPRDDVAELTIRTRKPVALDPCARERRTGRFVLIDGHDVCGGGAVARMQYPDLRTRRRPENVSWDKSLVTRVEREVRTGHPGVVIWMTGLSGAGKSTISRLLERDLFDRGALVYRLDGDNVRHGLNANLGFSPDDRSENIRRIAEVAALFADAGFIVVTSFISPYRSDRARARGIVAPGRFLEVFVDCPLAVCEERDPKGLYRKARAGEIESFTGISAPFETPEAPDIRLDTGSLTSDEAVERVLARLVDLALISEPALR